MLAKEKAGSCHTNPSPQHSPPFDHTGWNAHLAPYGAASFSEVIESWFEEGQDYLYLSGTCRENATCQHYTQVQQEHTAEISTVYIICIWSEILELFENFHFFSQVLMFCSSIPLLLCSWSGPLPVMLAVPATCV